ncbi:Uncharacterised protein [uncultured archaeon]|nr:Uncharacterised protein [uncultured archaeon]
MLTNKDYEKAIKEPGFRPEFIEQIELGDLSRYVLKLEYNPYQKERTEMTTIYPMSASIKGIKRKRSRILIYPLAFSQLLYPNIHDFCASVIYHEGLHAKENFEGITLAARLNNAKDIKIENAKIELRALSNQARHFNMRNSKTYVNQVRSRIKAYKRQLE